MRRTAPLVYDAAVLKIRRKQFSAFRQALRKSFEDHVVEVFRTSWSDAFERRGETSVRSFVQEWIPEAMAHGFSEEKDIAHFLHIMFAVVTDFGEDPRRVFWVQKELSDSEASVTGKLYGLYAELHAAYDRQKASRAGD